MEDNVLAMRSEAIIEAKYSLTNKQNMIMDMVLSEISDDDKLDYVLSIEKFRPLVTEGLTNLYRDLKSAVKSFEGKGFRITNKKANETIYYPWFSKIHYKPNQGEIIVRLDPDLKRLLYEVKKRIYYNIAYTINMKSSYSQRFYYFLKSFECTTWRYDKIEDLLSKLECPASCNNFARFESSVLKKAQAEINAQTDLNFRYEPFKTGRKVTHIKSYISTKNNINLPIREINTTYIINSLGGLINGEDDAQKILNVLKVIECDNKLAYFESEVDKVLKYHNKHKESSFIALILNALQNPWQHSSQQHSIGFNNFQPREMYADNDYMKKLENGLLGWDK